MPDPAATSKGGGLLDTPEGVGNTQIDFMVKSYKFRQGQDENQRQEV
jgi:hypothetical protein